MEQMLKLAKDMQSVALVADSYALVKKKKKKPKDFIQTGFTNIVGTELIRS